MLDTNVAVHLRDGDPKAQALLLSLDQMPSISAVTRVELEGGVHADPTAKDRRRQAVDLLLQDFTVLDFTDDIAGVYGRIVEAVGFSRRKIVDRMIAATALAHGLTLVTLNGRDFRDVPNLDLLEWSRSAA